MYMVTSIPVMAIAFVLGGMSWWALLGLFGMLLYLGIYVGSVGVFCSSVVKKSVMATILTITIGFGIIIASFIILYILIAVKAYEASLTNATTIAVGATPMIMLLNPYSPFVDFLIRSMSSYSLYDFIAEMGTVSPVYEVLYRGWIPVSVVLNLLVSLGFLKLAAMNIAVTRNKKQKNR